MILLKNVSKILILVLIAVIALSFVPVSVYGATVPSAPTGLSGVSNAGVVYLGWAEPVDDGGSAITGYRVYRGIMEDGLGIVEDVPGLSFSDTGLSTGETYYYAVSALNAEGESEKTDIVSVRPDKCVPRFYLSSRSVFQAFKNSYPDFITSCFFQLLEADRRPLCIGNISGRKKIK